MRGWRPGSLGVSVAGVERYGKGMSVRRRFLSRQVAHEMLMQTTDPRRTGEVYRVLGEDVEQRTRSLPAEAQWEVRMALKTMAFLMTRQTERGFGLGDHASTTAVAETLAKHGEVERIRDLLDKLVLFRVRAPPRVCLAYVRAFLSRDGAHEGGAQSALEALAELERAGFAPPEDLVADLLRDFGRAGATDQMTQLRVRLPANHPAIFVAEFCATAHRRPPPQRVWDGHHVPPDVDEPALMDLLDAEHDLDASVALLQQVLQQRRPSERNGRPLSIRPFVAVARKDPQRAEEFVDWGLSQGGGDVLMNEGAYGVLLHAAKLRGDRRRAEELLSEMRVAIGRCSHPDGFNAVIFLRSSSRTKDGQESALGLLREMLRSGVRANAETWRLYQDIVTSAAVEARERPSSSPTPEHSDDAKQLHGDHHAVISRALRVLHDGDEDGDKGGVSSPRSLPLHRERAILAEMNQLADLGLVQCLRQMIAHLRSRRRGAQAPFAASHIVALMRAHCARSEYTEALEVFECGGSPGRTSAAGRKPVKFNALQVVAILDLFSGAREVAKVVQKLRTSGWEASVDVQRAMLRAYSRAKERAEAQWTFEKLVKVDQAREEDFVEVMRLLGPKEATRLLDAMVSRHGIRPTFRSYNAVLEALVENDLPHKVETLIARMRAERVRPSQRTFALMIRAAGLRRDAVGAMRAYRTLLVNGLYPEPAVLLRLVEAYLQADEVDGALAISQHVARVHPGLKEAMRALVVDKHLRDGEFHRALVSELRVKLPTQEELHQRALHTKPKGEGQATRTRTAATPSSIVAGRHIQRMV